jgi:hypothetical protein
MMLPGARWAEPITPQEPPPPVDREHPVEEHTRGSAQAARELVARDVDRELFRGHGQGVGEEG